MKRIKKGHHTATIQTTTATQIQHQQPATVQTYETLGLDNDGELMETEGDVEYLHTTGMKMELPEFIDVPSSEAAGGQKTTTTVQENPPSYIQTSDNVTYQIIDGQVIKRSVNTAGQTTVVQTQEASQEQEAMEEQENESGEITMYQQDDDKNTTAQGGDDFSLDQIQIIGQQTATMQPIQRVIQRQVTVKEDGSGSTSNTICNHCQRTFTSASALRRHNLSKHSNIGVKFKCDVCSMSYKTKWSLSTHISRYHRAASEKLARKNKGKKIADQENTDDAEAGEITEIVFVKSE